MFKEGFLEVAFELDLKRWNEVPRGKLSSGAFQTEGTSI